MALSGLIRAGLFFARLLTGFSQIASKQEVRDLTRERTTLPPLAGYNGSRANRIAVRTSDQLA